ncbi:hypothetical protein CDIK_1977 [Cucumispora dikerogammari]|nr:hypothetical protein CDIK_1977 [Cucumispora dikerogammari]
MRISIPSIVVMFIYIRTCAFFNALLIVEWLTLNFETSFLTDQPSLGSFYAHWTKNDHFPRKLKKKHYKFFIDFEIQNKEKDKNDKYLIKNRIINKAYFF